MEEVEGKTVERVAIEDKLSIRRASRADWWTVGISYSRKKNGGWERRCRVGGVEAETRETMERRSPVGSNIVVERCITRQITASQKTVVFTSKLIRWTGDPWTPHDGIDIDRMRTKLLMRRLRTS